MILLTGGAGYIGSHVAKELLLNGEDVLIYDNLSTGCFEAVEAVNELRSRYEGAGKLVFVPGDTENRRLLLSVLKMEKITAIVHLAAYSLVGESMQNPGKYFDNNTSRALNILECMVASGVNKLVFSSTAAVYGEPLQIPITEDQPTVPTNVYGASKLMVEQLLSWYDKIFGIKYITMRYFNAAGADASGLIGEMHSPETHLIPRVIQKVLGQRDEMVVYGDDYTTPDGTCIRDYVHVSDIAQAHILAVQALLDDFDSNTFNIGNESGYSVQEVIDAVSSVTGKEINYKLNSRRVGDPAILVANSDRIRKHLGWKPRYPLLKDIVSSAWKWHKGLS